MRLEGKSVVFEVDMSWKLLAEAQADGRVEQIYEVSGEEVRRLK